MSNKSLDKYKAKFRREFDSLLKEKSTLEKQMNERHGVSDIEYYREQIEMIDEKLDFWNPIFR
jgi:hypothetical protein